MNSTQSKPDNPSPEATSGRHEAEPNPITSEAEDVSREIVTIRRRLAEVDQGLEAMPADAVEAIEALNDRAHDLRERLAELQSFFTEPLEGSVDPDDLISTDRPHLTPRV